ncbi:MAG: glycerophosphodiester phosphodiesterase family protein [Spirochaetes bacterium]|nr:glycerophosphodiester phosphodiesterase family protein [Spirochaetota bacterium]
MTIPAGIIAIAHRGFRSIAPENTLAAAEAGFACGADAWELDVAATSDGELVVIHDDTLRRTTNAAAAFPAREPWTVHDFTLAEIETLDAGSWYAGSDPFGRIASGEAGPSLLAGYRGVRVPTLRGCLGFTKSKGWLVNVEIKDASGWPCHAWIVERTVELVRELGMVDSVIVSSFNHDYIRRVKLAEPRLDTGALVDKVAPSDPVALLRETGARSYNPGREILTEATVVALRAGGFDIFPWTVNSEADMRRLLDWGVTGIITDFPDRLLKVLDRRSRY